MTSLAAVRIATRRRIEIASAFGDVPRMFVTGTSVATPGSAAAKVILSAVAGGLAYSLKDKSDRYRRCHLIPDPTRVTAGESLGVGRRLPTRARC
jgi:hypothetical protein